MALCRKVEGLNDLNMLISTLRAGFPRTQHVWQLVSEVRDKKVDANIYTDRWPNFTTVISQEFAPRLSEVADLRVYTTDKERVVPLLKDARLLDNIGTWQLIHYILGTEDCTALVAHLLEFLQCYPKTKDKTATLLFDNGAFMPMEVEDSSFISLIIPPLPSGFYAKDIPPEAAEFVAKHWTPPASMEYPLEHRTRFIKEVINRFEMIGAYTSDNPYYPVAFAGQKPGGVIGLSFTHKDYRHRKINSSLTLEVARRIIEKGGKVFGETNEENVQMKRDGYEHAIGRSQIIAIY